MSPTVSCFSPRVCARLKVKRRVFSSIESSVRRLRAAVRVSVPGTFVESGGRGRPGGRKYDTVRVFEPCKCGEGEFVACSRL